MAGQLGATDTHLIAAVTSRLPSCERSCPTELGGFRDLGRRSGQRSGRSHSPLVVANVVLVGLNKTPQPLNLADIVLREVNVQTTVAHVCGTDIPEALELLDRVHLSEVLPAYAVPLDDVVAEASNRWSTGTAARQDPRGSASWLTSCSSAPGAWVRRWQEAGGGQVIA